MKWQGVDWNEQAGRFRCVDPLGFVNWDYRRAYWFADAASLVLARAYLRSIEPAFQVLTDEADGEPFVIVTDYER